MIVQLSIRTSFPLGAQCDVCSLCDDAPVNPVFGEGPLDAKLVFVGESPSYSDIRAGSPFHGSAGDLLWDELKRYGIKREDVFVTNTLLCMTPHGKPVKAKNINACRARLTSELTLLTAPRVIVCLGATAIQAMRGVKSSLNQFSGRNEWSEEFNTHIAYAYNPAAVLIRPELYQDFAFGISQAIELLEIDGPIPAEEDITWHTATNADEAVRELVAMFQLPPTDISCDIETTGLDALKDRILRIGFSCTDSTAFILPEALLLDARVRDVLQTFMEKSAHTFVYHNGKFDTQFIRTQLKIQARIGGDSMLLHYCLDERSGGEGGGYHDLKRLSHKYCGAPLYAAEIDRANLAEVAPETLDKYLAYDCVYTRRLWKRLCVLVEREPASREGYPSPKKVHDKLLIPAANAIADIEMRGIRIDIRRLLDLIDDYRGKNAAAQLLCTELAGTYISVLDAKTRAKGLNPNSTMQVSKILTAMGYPVLGSTNEASLHEQQRWDIAQGRPFNPFIDAVLDYRSLLHTQTTYFEGIAKRLFRGKQDGRLRTSLLLHGTTTGRLASRDPNLQNLPKDSVVKEVFIPSPGRILVEADFRRLEVGVLAWYSGDEKLTKDFLAEDFHWNVAHAIFPGIIARMEAARTIEDLEAVAGDYSTFADFAARQARPSERTDDMGKLYEWLKTRLRRQAKYVSFGIMYGEGARSLSQPEKGLGVPVHEAQAFINSWKANYPQAMAFLNKQVRLATKERWIESASGRRRRFAFPASIQTHIANEAMNQPIQALASDIDLKSLTILNTELPERGLGDVLMAVHDSLLCEVEIARLDEGIAHIRSVMTSVIVDDDVFFDVDIAVGPNWADLAHR